MSDVVIEFSGITKHYQLGEIGTGTLSRDLNRWWARIRGREDPYKTIQDKPITNLRTAEEKQIPNQITALDDVSFQVKHGEVLGIIGRNGAGKSTLLKILSRVTAPSSGSIKVRGRIASLLEVGTGFHPELTGRDNIYLNGAILGMTKSDINREFDQIVEFSGCSKYIETPVKRYSSGMYVRLAFSVAAHLRTDILIVDEVLAVGDMEFQKKCLNRMGEVAKQGRSVIVVSHNMASINNLCTRAILIDKGKVAGNGSVEDIIPRYLNSGVIKTGVFKPKITEVLATQNVGLLEVSIRQEGSNTPTSEIDISKNIIITITYECLKEGHALLTAIWLKDSMGVFVLCSGNAPDFNSLEDSWYGKAHPKGVYHSSCVIPANFLNYGKYYITPILGTPPSTVEVLLEDALSFIVHDTGSSRATSYTHRIGVVQPALPWTTVEG